ncbi:MAG: serine/threonine phosphatase PrpC [Labilithrix sp.]|nr:serine/threonine phosphatase PrpC [Labilithrix sp.]
MADQSKTPPVEIAVRTDPGRDPEKQVNEDAAAQAEAKLGLLAVVCDGMGGHAGGKEASELAVKTILEIVQAAPEKTTPRDALRVAIEEANRRVWSMPTNEGGYRPGSTVVAVLAHPGGAEIAHVGDSRIYLIHSGAITQVTKDHSMVQEMVDRNIIKAEDAAKHPDANKIMRALGIAKEVEVDVRPEPLAYVAGDVFVLCSDGLSDLVNASEILDIAGSRPAAQAAGQLVDLANARGGHDNITAMVMRMKGSAAVSEAATIVKTMPLTAHEPVSSSAPAEQGAGPRGTVLTAPLQAPSSPAVAAPPATDVPSTVLAAPLAAPSRPQANVAAAIPPGPPPPSSERGERSKVPLIAGIVLGVVALGVAATVVWMDQRPNHAPVKVVPFDASRPVPTEEDAGTVAPDITLAPVLAPPSGVKVPWWKDPDASTPTGEPRECAIARWQKDAGRPSSSWEPLEAKCRAAGGKP